MRTAALGAPTDPPQVAFSVGRAVGGAVVRNRVRRQLRAALREHAELLRPGTGYLVRAGAGTSRASYAELSGTVRALLVDDEAMSR
jgi:ribonuclease P protein component